MDCKREYTRWLEGVAAVDYLADELKGIADKPKEIEERFYRELEFGTGGLRGIIGAGTNRMNIFTVMRAAMGVAKYLTENYASPSVAIAYDSREKSQLFAEVSAGVYAAFGVKAYVFRELMPTPLLSFAVRYLKASGGVVVTASHNPKQYNGYKVYNDTGCQITAEAAESIQNNILAGDYFGIPCKDFKTGLADGSIGYIDDSLVEAFYDEAQKLSAGDGDIGLKIVYTPLNGTGNKPVREILRRIGCKDITVVPEQENPDSAFTTCPYPNPEIREALQKAIELAGKTGADFILATDPDCDRVGIAVRHNGEITLLSGNETGILLTEYLLSRAKSQGSLPKNPIVVSTIVSTTMIEKIAAEYGGSAKFVYTGFKFIGEFMNDLDSRGELNRYMLGFEESYGYLPGTYARDKDGVGTSMLICEMADYYAQKGQDLVEVLESLYKKYGYYKSSLKSFEFKGKEGSDKMKSLIAGLRQTPPASLANQQVTAVRDYMSGEDGMIPMDVLEYRTEGVKLIVRPSGTEPKLKVYVHTSGADRTLCEKLTADALADITQRLV